MTFDQNEALLGLALRALRSCTQQTWGDLSVELGQLGDLVENHVDEHPLRQYLIDDLEKAVKVRTNGDWTTAEDRIRSAAEPLHSFIKTARNWYDAVWFLPVDDEGAVLTAWAMPAMGWRDVPTLDQYTGRLEDVLASLARSDFRTNRESEEEPESDKEEKMIASWMLDALDGLIYGVAENPWSDEMDPDAVAVEIVNCESTAMRLEGLNLEEGHFLSTLDPGLKDYLENDLSFEGMVVMLA